jgi:hypothetical protein
MRNPTFYQDANPPIAPEGLHPVIRGTKEMPSYHGYHTLPDGTMTPLYHQHALVVARDGTLYVTILYPFTLLRIELGDYPR